jgi:hypothetical protein
MSLIKEAQELQTSAQLIVEACEKYNVPTSLLESLDGVLHSYIQRINGGQMARFAHGDLYALANIFALASMIGATDASGLDTTTANGVLNLYKTAKPGDNDQTTHDIQQMVDGLPAAMQQKFRTLANAWGKNLQITIEKNDPATMKNISNRLLKAVTLLQTAVGKIESQHRENIDRSSVQAAKWRNGGRGGVLGR